MCCGVVPIFVWLVFEGPIPTCGCFHLENFFVAVCKQTEQAGLLTCIQVTVFFPLGVWLAQRRKKTHVNQWLKQGACSDCRATLQSYLLLPPTPFHISFFTFPSPHPIIPLFPQLSMSLSSSASVGLRLSSEDKEDPQPCQTGVFESLPVEKGGRGSVHCTLSQ